MSKIIVFLAIFLFAANSIWGQVTPVAAYRIANNSTAVGANMPVGTQIFSIAEQKLYVVVRAVSSSITIETGLGDSNPYFKEINGITLTTTPSAKDVSISGTAAIASTLTGNYTYIASQTTGLSEGTSTFKWYYASDASGSDKMAIGGATDITYTVASPVEMENYVAFGVTPVSIDGKIGEEVFSSWVNVIITAPDGTFIADLTSTTGRVWMDRNLGASREAVSDDDYLAYGSLFQWGRAADGHEKVINVSYNSATAVNGTTNTLSTSTDPGHSLFIINSNSPYDWLSSQQSDLWWNGEVAGSNNPCPTGYHVPTYAEWMDEVAAGITGTITGYSQLKLTLACQRSYVNGSVGWGSCANYWMSTIYQTRADNLSVCGGSASRNTSNRAYGYSVRCIKSLDIPVAESVLINGSVSTGGTVTGNYTYKVPQTGSPEGYSIYKWYYATDAQGTGKTLINGAVDISYTIASPVVANKYLAFGVTPVSAEGKVGTEVLSSWEKVLLAASDGTLVVELTSPTGRIWMDRNLGATQTATSSTDYLAYGSFFQWCRAADGHEKITWASSTTGTPVNGTTSTLSTTSNPEHSLFIVNNSSPYDWLSSQQSNGDLWWNGSATGANTPCPTGYHVPTQAEWQVEIAAGISNSVTAFSSLKLSLSGFRYSTSGSLFNVSSFGAYWSSSVGGTNAYGITIDGSSARMEGVSRTFGFNVRCIKTQ